MVKPLSKAQAGFHGDSARPWKMEEKGYGCLGQQAEARGGALLRLEGRRCQKQASLEGRFHCLSCSGFPRLVPAPPTDCSVPVLVRALCSLQPEG